MLKFLSYILTPLFFLCFGLILLVFHIPVVLGKVLFGYKGIDAVISIMNLSLIKSLQFTLGMRYVYHGFRKISTDKPVVFVSNHQSMWDIPPIMWKFRKNHPKFVAKKELTGILPSVSFNLKYGGHITIDRSKPNDALDKIRAFTKQIRDHNFSISIFPEGTRSRDGKVGKFKTKGIQVILEEIQEVLVVPLAMHNTRQIDNDGKFFKKLGTRIHITMLEPRKLEINNLESSIEAIQNEISAIVEKHQEL